jgi:hypothetical protein
MMLLRLAVILSVAFAAAQGAAAQPKRAAPAKTAKAHQQPRRATPTPVLQLVSTPRDSAERWTLQPIDGDYDRADTGGFRLRVRGAKMKMRVPLDLN